jgi:hypothetical protein
VKQKWAESWPVWRRLNTSTVVLRVTGGDGKRTQCLGVQLGHPVPGGYKYGNLFLQVGGVSNRRQYNLVMSPAGFGPENDCAVEGSNCKLQTHNLVRDVT